MRSLCNFLASALATFTFSVAPAHAESAAADVATPKAAAAGSASAATTQKLTFTNELVGKAKTWLPKSAKVKAGEKLELTLTNTLADPHGFQVPGLLTQPVVVAGKETKTLTIDAPKAGTYKFNCQLHPAHVGGEIVVQ